MNPQGDVLFGDKLWKMSSMKDTVALVEVEALR